MDQVPLDLAREKFEWKKKYQQAQLALGILQFADTLNFDEKEDEENLRYQTSLRNEIISASHRAIYKFFCHSQSTPLSTDSSPKSTRISPSRPRSVSSSASDLILHLSSESIDHKGYYSE